MPSICNFFCFFKRIFYNILVGIILCCVLFIVVEGSVGWFYAVRSFIRNSTNFFQVKHLDYDSLVGWINKPNIHLTNVFGQGKDITINEDRHRITEQTDIYSSIQVVCSGDSFTFGSGVGDFDTWCSLLHANGWNTFNFGQDGYGMDQMYLRYQRDAEHIPHSIHIMAIIDDDVERMLTPFFIGLYGKPFFQIENGILTNINYPVRQNLGLPTWLFHMRVALSELHLSTAIDRSMSRFKSITIHFQSKQKKMKEQLTEQILTQIYKTSKKRNASFFLVLLPIYAGSSYQTEYVSHYREKSKILNETASKNGFNVIDVGEEMFRMDSEIYASFFLQPSDLHNSKLGNIFIARIVSETIKKQMLENTP